MRPDQGRLPTPQKLLLGALLFFLIVVQIRQPYPDVAPLHHIPTTLLLLSSPWLLARWPMSTTSVACIVAFFALHTLGGRYTYTNVPYDDWSMSIFGRTISEPFGFARNHYDRLVHLSYGLLVVPPTREFLERHLHVGPRLALYIAVESVLAASAIYELVEWFLSIALAGPMAADYNGQQGDMWDAQKDMALATLGALLSAIILKIRGMPARWQTK